MTEIHNICNGEFHEIESNVIPRSLLEKYGAYETVVSKMLNVQQMQQWQINFNQQMNR